MSTFLSAHDLAVTNDGWNAGGGWQVWLPKFSCRCVRVLSLVRRPWRTFNCRY